jgi:hypothetical protein
MLTRLILTIAWLAALSVAHADQQCNESVNSTTPLQRFSIELDGTVRDRRTGLQWQRCPAGYAINDGNTPIEFSDDSCEAAAETRLTWRQSFDAAAALTIASGQSDWRLPNLKELMSIAERKCVAPALNLLVFPNITWQQFWSSTTFDITNTAATLNFRGAINATAPKDSLQSVRLVR